MTGGEPLVRWDWIASHLPEIGGRLLQHVAMTAIAVFVGFLVAFILVVLIDRWRAAYGPVTGIAGVLYTIPSLALFALLVPFTGLTYLTTEIALVSYTIFILVRNIVTGLDGVPPDVVESAEGMGYTRRQRFLRIRLPLAAPAIVAGLRIATITTIGLVAVTATLGNEFGGLGYFIVRLGIDRLFSTPLLVGAILSVVLAIVADRLFVRLERAITPWARARG